VGEASELTGLTTLAVMVLASLIGTRAQSSETFEVASIRPSRNSSAGSNFDSAPGGRLTATNITVKYLIRLAYDVKDYQIERAPGWVDSEQYDIAAKSASGRNTGLEEEKSMLRDLLANRFQMATHRETKQMQVYLLVVGKNGPKLKESNASRTTTRKGCGHLAGTRLTMDVIATILSRQFERDVLNRTDFPGKYDFQLDWTPDAGPCPAAEGPDGATANLPSIFTAVQQQLGLKLESSKGPVEILVIDHVERPSEN
jgi:uncharacterized protein (TIGR03435 family)